MNPAVAILGPGLLGGSLALALRERGAARVALWARRSEAVQEARARGCADAVSSDLAEIVRKADCVVLATPIGAMAGLARAAAPHLKPGALVTDVGSVKAPVVRELGRIFAGRARFIGSHPMAGSEQSGLDAARADLFQDAVCIVTPVADSAPGATDEATRLWTSVGASVRILGPAEHDAFVAWISHLPHLLAATLVEAVGRGCPGAFDFCGPGFRDTTRVASGPPGMWTEILGTNREAVRAAVDGLIEKLRAVSTLLASAPDAERDAFMNQLLTDAKARRDALRLPKIPSDA
jgi:prephenate dehydrogenase